MTVRTSGIRLEDFLKNPVCLLNHNYDKVLGLWEDVQKVGTTLSGVPVFDTEDADANKYYGQVERDVLKGSSIGIIPITVEGTEIVESDLLEISITPVPGNRNALVIYNAKGVRLDAKEAQAYLLAISPTQKEDENNPKFMNPKLLAALVMLCANAGLTVQLSATPTDTELEAAIAGISNKVTALNLSNSQLTAVNIAFKAKETAAIEIEKSTVLNLAVLEKRITESQRETFSKLWDADPALAKETLTAMAPVTLSVIPGAKKAAEDQQSADEKANWTFDDFATNAPLELTAMQAANPEKFNQLYDNKVTALKAAGAIIAV